MVVRFSQAYELQNLIGIIVSYIWSLMLSYFCN